MKARVPSVMHEVVFHQRVRGTFVIVEPPAAVAMAGDVVDVIAANDRARRGAETVKAAHVAQIRPTEMMDVIVLDERLARSGVAIAPVPSGADAGVVKVADIAMRDRAVLRVREDHAASARMQPTAVLDDAVIDDDVMIYTFFIRPGRFTDIDAAAAEVVEVAMLHGGVCAAVFEPDAMQTRMRDLAVLEVNAARVFDLDAAITRRGRLTVVQTIRRIQMLAESKRDAFKAHVVSAFHHDELRHHWRDDFRLRHVLARPRQVKHLALRLVEKPLARRIQRRAIVLHPEALIRLELDKGIPRPSFDLQGERFIIQRLDAALPHGPGMRHGEQHVVALGLRDGFEHIELLGGDAEGMEIHVLLQIRKHTRSDGLGDVVVALVRRASQRRAAAIDPHLLKLPRFVRQRGFPHLTLFDPAGDRLASHEDGVLAAPRNLRVVFAKCDGLRDRMHAVLDDDAHRFGSLAGLFERLSQVPWLECDISGASQLNSS